MTEISPAEIASKAKRHLGLPETISDVRVPSFYLQELSRHLALYPDEDNFTVTLQPGISYGSVTCLKAGCGQVVPLTKRGRTRDGGKVDGMGSLTAYRTHLADSPIHIAERKRAKTGVTNSRTIATSSVSAPPVTVKTEPSSSAATRALGATQSRNNKAVAQDKAATFETTASRPRKRLSDVAFKQENLEAGTSVASISAPPHNNALKKVKLEAIAKPIPPSPLTPRTTNSQGRKADMVAIDLGIDQSPRAKLDNVRVALDGQIQLRSRYVVRGNSKGVANCDKEITRLRDMEAVYRSMVLATTSSAVVKPEPVDYALSSSSAGPSLLRARLNAFPMTMDVDVKPAVDAKPVPTHPPIRDTAYNGLIFRKPTPTTVPKRKATISAPVPERKSIIVNASASSSAARPSVKQEQVNVNMKASSSKLPAAGDAMPGAFPSVAGRQYPKIPAFSSDDEGEGASENDDSYEYDLAQLDIPNPAPFIERVGVNVRALDDDAFDNNGDYYGRGKDLYVGPQARNDDIEKFLQHAGNSEVFDGNTTVEKALAKLGLKTLEHKIPGMEVTLLAHQALGVAWMVEKEQSSMRGGCLADEMGLGKTIQMIACMMKNKPTDQACKTTLILAPVALLDQWKQEIELRTNCGLECLIYHGASRTKSKKQLLKHDIVLTSFNTMAHEWPDYETEMKRKQKAKKRGDDFIASSDDEDMKDHRYRAKKRKDKAGLLFQVDFYRIIADEGQNIRNRRTRVSRAITELQSTLRWCLTGTPIVNGLSDTYPYLRFLQVKPWYDFDEFQNRIGKHEKKQPQLAVTRLQAIMATFLLRRKKDTMMNGEKLIELPEKEVKLIKLEFTEDERDIYKMVEAKTQDKFNRYLRAGTVLKNYHQVLVLLLRLRQICSHPSLIQERVDAFVRPGEGNVDIKLEFASELSRARRLVSEEFVNKIKAKFKAEALARMEAEQKDSEATIEEEECPICTEADMTDAVITSCGHIYCRECIVNYINTQPPKEAGDNNEQNRGCPICRGPIDENKLFARSAFEPTDKELKGGPSVEEDSDIEMIDVDASDDEDEDDYFSKKSKGKGKARAQRGPRRSYQESDDEGDDVYQDDSDDDMSDFIVHSDEDEEEKDARRAIKKRFGKKRPNVILDSDDEMDTPEEKEVYFGKRTTKNISQEAIKLMPRFLPSSKMMYMMKQLQKLLKTNPEEKTLIVSQWTSCLSLVSDYLTENGIVHVKYQGDMNRNKRDQAVQVFMAKEKARVMLMSLKCGGVGLNLTRANNVISLDLGWSQAVENQAFDRVHRLGQKRKVTVQRVVIADTVEDRILRMQERKQQLADGSLGEGSGKKLGRLNVKELAGLFGLDTRGRVLTD